MRRAPARGSPVGRCGRSVAARCRPGTRLIDPAAVPMSPAACLPPGPVTASAPAGSTRSGRSPARLTAPPARWARRAEPRPHRRANRSPANRSGHDSSHDCRSSRRRHLTRQPLAADALQSVHTVQSPCTGSGRRRTPCVRRAQVGRCARGPEGVHRPMSCDNTPVYGGSYARPALRCFRGYGGGLSADRPVEAHSHVGPLPQRSGRGHSLWRA
jgi:hypothetical protein